MSETIRPARAVAPGRIILRELEERGWSQQDLAEIMGRPQQMISEIINAKKQITVETACQLAKAFGTSPEFWLNLEMKYQLLQANKAVQVTDIERRSRLYDLAPMNELIKRGWITASKSIEELEAEFCRFFQVSSIDQQPRVVSSLRVSAERGPEERAIVAWLRRVEQLAAEQSIGPFSPDHFPGLLAELLGFAKDETAIQNIPELFLKNGIHFIVVPHLQRTYLDGAALWVNDHPVVALSLRYDRIDYFWFTLLHETAHIYRKHRQSHVDRLFDHDQQSQGQEEDEANELATKWLLPEKDFQEFIELHRPRYSRLNLEQFSTEQKRHPGIIVGQLMHQGELSYSHLREYLVKVRPYLEKWEDVSNPNWGD